MASIVVIYETGLIRAVQTDGRKWNRREAQEVQAAAVLRAPARTGRLKRSHGVEQNRNRLGQYQTGFIVYADAPYAGWVHGGTGPYTSPPGKVMGPLLTVGPGGAAGVSGPAGAPRFIRHRRGQAPQPWLQQAADAVL